MSSAIHGRMYHGVDPIHISKLWRINVDTVKRTLDVTSQGLVWNDNPKLAKNYVANDQML